jgi:SAM-dependent methyltransferase
VTEDKEWFESWFDSPYYHILYEDRDRDEAQLFIDNLLRFLKPPPHARMLDVACGRGRHAVYLNNMGYDVDAFDLSESNIAYDKQFENECLRFYRHDMRELFPNGNFDFVFNLFSSFGYFDTDEENRKVIEAHAAALKNGGTLVLDYLNTQLTANCLKEHEQKVIGDITFHIHKSIAEGSVIKTIKFTAEGRAYKYSEKLRLFTLQEFEQMLEACAMQIQHVFGNYLLEPFEALASERLILIAVKN